MTCTEHSSCFAAAMLVFRLGLILPDSCFLKYHIIGTVSYIAVFAVDESHHECEHSGSRSTGIYLQIVMNDCRSASS